MRKNPQIKHKTQQQLTCQLMGNKPLIALLKCYVFVKPGLQYNTVITIR